MSFDTLGLCADIIRAVREKGYEVPTPIQRAAVPVILSGSDVLAGAQTGTGKTAAFTLPLLERLQRQPRPDRPIRALVLTPTRELAAQVAESIQTYGRYLPFRTLAVFGGVSAQPQIQALEQGVDILVATPGRLLDHIDQQAMDLSKVEILVLDEADRMLDMGFIHDLRRILAVLPAARQSLLFSATFSADIRSLADTLLTRPVAVDVAPRNAATALVEHRVHLVDQARKRAVLSSLIHSGQWPQVLVFTRTKHGANRLAYQLEADGLRSAAIHGNKSQGARTRALADFKAGHVRVLVATDIAARGLDIDQLPHVVNFDMPQVPEDYVHRIGRTGRAGAPGTALSLIDPEERPLLQAIEALLHQALPVFPAPEILTVPGDTAAPATAEPTAGTPLSDPPSPAERKPRRRARRRPQSRPTTDTRAPVALAPAGRIREPQAPRGSRPGTVRGLRRMGPRRDHETAPVVRAAPPRTSEGEVDGNSVHYVPKEIPGGKGGRGRKPGRPAPPPGPMRMDSGSRGNPRDQPMDRSAGSAFPERSQAKVRTVEVRQRVRPGRPQAEGSVQPGIRRTERSK